MVVNWMCASISHFPNPLTVTMTTPTANKTCVAHGKVQCHCSDETKWADKAASVALAQEGRWTIIFFVTVTVALITSYLLTTPLTIRMSVYGVCHNGTGLRNVSYDIQAPSNLHVLQTFVSSPSVKDACVLRVEVCSNRSANQCCIRSDALIVRFNRLVRSWIEDDELVCIGQYDDYSLQHWARNMNDDYRPIHSKVECEHMLPLYSLSLTGYYHTYTYSNDRLRSALSDPNGTLGSMVLPF